MGACFHIEGVECDNCRGSRPYFSRPPIITTTGTNLMPTVAVPNLVTSSELHKLRKEFRDIVAKLVLRIDGLEKALYTEQKKPKTRKPRRRG